MQANIEFAHLVSMRREVHVSLDRDAVKRFLRAAAGRSLNSTELDQAFQFLDLGDLPTFEDYNETDRAYSSLLSDISTNTRLVAAGKSRRNVIHLDRKADGLAQTADRWSVKKALAWLSLQSVQPNADLAIVATARNEGINILEWLAFHRAVGVQHIFLYTNDNDDKSLPLYRCLANAGELTLIENEVDGSVPSQLKAYEHALYALPELRKFRWVSFIDLDEFIKPNGASFNIQTLIDEAKLAERELSSIFLHWRWFGSSGQISMTDEPVLTRFTESRADTHGKSICRLIDVLSMRPIHYPTLVAGRKVVDSELRPVENPAQTIPCYGRAQINHYWNKSFEEFVLKKARGIADVGRLNGQRSYSQFFQWDTTNGAEERLRDDVLAATTREYERLVAIPTISGLLDDVRQTVRACTEKFASPNGLKQLYESERKAAGR